ncbi:hypothetical protein GCM10009646_86900 [Streptomyces aureus]
MLRWKWWAHSVEEFSAQGRFKAQFAVGENAIGGASLAHLGGVQVQNFTSDADRDVDRQRAFVHTPGRPHESLCDRCRCGPDQADLLSAPYTAFGGCVTRFHDDHHSDRAYDDTGTPHREAPGYHRATAEHGYVLPIEHQRWNHGGNLIIHSRIILDHHRPPLMPIDCDRD